MKKEIMELVKSLVGNEYLYFDSEVTVKLSPHSHPCNIWAICASPLNRLYIMDIEQEWYEVDDKDETIIASLYQRVQLIHKKYKAA